MKPLRNVSTALLREMLATYKAAARFGATGRERHCAAEAVVRIHRELQIRDAQAANRAAFLAARPRGHR